ncbi:MAG: TlpA family protein disulfide reductase [Bacteroidaceae bacterium]
MKTRHFMIALLAMVSGAFCSQSAVAQCASKGQGCTRQGQTCCQGKGCKEKSTATAAASNVVQLSDTLSGTNIFKQIVARYKGQPVLVDFWATWCGPCRMAMKTIQPLKEELWGKCAFVYVTGPSSPKDTWTGMIKDIHGDHFYVSEAQWATLMKQFQVQGIPAYIVVDAKGKMQQKHIGFPGEDVLREELVPQQKAK